ncbi:magnesium/cobalt transporter CorA [bacterium]|nr:magnesium/cobalt transporter CorA [bacterium]
MPRLFHRVKRPAAQSPGTLDFTGEKKVERVGLEVVDYGGDHLATHELDSVAECARFAGTDTVTWLNVTGLHDTALIRELGETFGVHPLALEDVVNPHQRPKLDDYGDHLFITCRMPRAGRGSTDMDAEQLAVVLGRGLVITFQERPGDAFDPVRERLRRGRSRLRDGGADYLAYALLDAVVDRYFFVAEAFGEAIEEIEEIVLAGRGDDPLGSLHELRRELVVLRRAVMPLREVVSALVRSESELIAPTTVPFLRDAHDHATQVGDAVDTFRDMLTSLQEVAMANASNRLNDVMRVLTIFASIFVPLTFLAGIYGMNFETMPELAWRWGYPVFWIVTLVVAGIMLGYFRWKRWL